MEREVVTRVVICVVNCGVEKFSEALFSAHIISERLLNDIQREAKLSANNYSGYSNQMRMRMKLLEVVQQVAQADPGKMKAILEVVERFSQERLLKSNGMLSITD